MCYDLGQATVDACFAEIVLPHFGPFKFNFETDHFLMLRNNVAPGSNPCYISLYKFSVPHSALSSV